MKQKTNLAGYATRTLLFALFCFIFSIDVNAQITTTPPGPYWDGTSVPTRTDGYAVIGDNTLAFPAPPGMPPTLRIKTYINGSEGAGDQNITSLNIDNFRKPGVPPVENVVQVYAASTLGGIDPLFIIGPMGNTGINTMPDENFMLDVKGKGHFSDKVLIGDADIINPSTTNPLSYKLFVEQGILTEKVKVAVKNTSEWWADYVFDNDYKLKPLSEVHSFIKQNKHLPDVPSAADVARDGIDLARMDATLLQKIEELTLYMIDLKKENEQLKTRCARLETKINK